MGPARGPAQSSQFKAQTTGVDHVYWANFSTGTIGRANLDGTGANPSFIITNSVAFGVAVDAD